LAEYEFFGGIQDFALNPRASRTRQDNVTVGIKDIEVANSVVSMNVWLSLTVR
jgi:hypothetical protein